MSDEPRAPLLGRARPRHLVVLDGVLAIGYGVLIWGVSAQTTASRSTLSTAAVLGAVSVALARRHPPAGLLAGLGMFWLCPLTGPAAETLAFLALAPTIVVLFRVAATYRTGPAVAALIVSLPAAAATTLPHLTYRGGALPFALTFCTTWTAGLAVGHRRRYADDLRRPVSQPRPGGNRRLDLRRGHGQLRADRRGLAFADRL